LYIQGGPESQPGLEKLVKSINELNMREKQAISIVLAGQDCCR